MGQSQHLFLLLGEAGLREEWRAKLLRQLPKENQGIELIKFYGDEFSIESFSEQALTYPFLSARQYLHLNQIELLSKDHLEFLTSFLPKIPEFTVLICEGENLDRRTSFYQTFRKLGTVQELEMGSAYQMVEQVMGRLLAAKGKRIRREAAAVLTERLGNSVLLISQAIEQLAIFVGARADITQEDVLTFVEREVPYGPFELTNALAAKDTGKTLEIYRFLLERLERDAVELVGLISWQLKRLCDVQILKKDGLSEAELARELSIPPFAVRQLVQSAARFSRQELREACDELFRLDWQMKTGLVNSADALETFLLRRTGAKLLQR